MSAKIIPISRAERSQPRTPEQYLEESGVASLPEKSSESQVRGAAHRLAGLLEEASYSMWIRVRRAAIARGVPACILDEVLGPPPEPPQPLMRSFSDPDEYPVEALGSLLGRVARAIAARVKAPVAMAGQSVLAVATLVVQGFANVALPFGQKRPLSSFFLTIAESGERKSAVDEIALKVVRRHEKALRQHHAEEHLRWENKIEARGIERNRIMKSKEYKDVDARARALDKLGAVPPKPSHPMLTCPEPTFEGLTRFLVDSQPAIGIFSAEGGQFVGGYGMSKDQRLKTAAGLSTLWDGTPLRRVRAGEVPLFLVGRRISLHLMVQPLVAEGLLSDPVLLDQGLLSRLLVVWPESLQGKRFESSSSALEDGPESDFLDAMAEYERRLDAIVGEIRPLADGTPNELRPRVLQLSLEARELWKAFSQEVEKELGPNGEYAPIRGLANKLAEHAARIAAVLALVEDLGTAEIRPEYMHSGIRLARYYASQALRLFGSGRTNPTLHQAGELLRWLQERWSHEMISLPDIYQRGPNAIRDKATAKRLVRVLEDHGWLLFMGPAEVNGESRRETWQIQYEGPARE